MPSAIATAERSVCLVSLGCSKALVDSEVMVGHLGRAGMTLVTSPEDSDVVIINVVLLEPKAGLDHLSVVDAARLITELKPKVAILTHYGMHVWQAKPWEIAERLTQETGITVRAAYDGMKFELAQVESNG